LNYLSQQAGQQASQQPRCSWEQLRGSWQQPRQHGHIFQLLARSWSAGWPGIDTNPISMGASGATEKSH